MLNELDLTDFDQPVEQLSGGQRKRAALVRVLMSEGDILILDEPTNHLDHEMSQWLENYLLKFRGAIVLVTHDRVFSGSGGDPDRGDRSWEILQLSRQLFPVCGAESGAAEYGDRHGAETTEHSAHGAAMAHAGARARSTKQKAHIQRIEQMQEIQAPDVAEQKVEMSSVASRLGAQDHRGGTYFQVL